MDRRLLLVLLFSLVLVLAACGGNGEVAGTDALVVTDGTTDVSYTIEDLEALGAAEAAFGEVTYVGVPLTALLEDAGFDPAGLNAVKATAADGFSANYEPDLVTLPDTLVAFSVAGGAAMSEDDGIFRMVLPGQEGKLNVRQLVELRVYPE